MKEIIFIVETPVLNRDIVRLEIGELRAKGAFVTILELSQILQPDAAKMICEDVCNYDSENVKKISSWLDFEEHVIRKSNSMFIVKLGNGPYTHRLYKTFKRYKVQYTLLLPEIVPASSCKESKAHLKSYIRKLKKSPFISLYNSLYKRLIPLLRIQPAKYVLYSGDGGHELKNILTNYKVDSNTKYHSIASLAYQECKKIELEKKHNIQDEYLVFIDQGFPVHPDLKNLNIVIPYDEYYGNINRALLQLSKDLNLKVIVAQHPRVSYKQNPFDDSFICIKGKTNKLVKDSKLVVYHFSESINYIAYFNKPVLVLTMDCLENEFGYTIKTKADSIGASVCNISRPSIFEKGLASYISHDEIMLSQYRTKYLPAKFEYESLSTAYLSISKDN